MNIQKELSITRELTTNVPMRGAATWSKEGEWLPESESNRFRLILGKNPQTYIAIQASHKSFKDQLTHLNIKVAKKDGVAENVSVNIGSLSKRAQLSIATILFKKITGQLTLDYLEEKVRKAQDNIEVYNKIIENGRARAIESGQDPVVKTQELRKLIRMSLKSRRISKGIFHEIGQSGYIAQKDPKYHLRLMEMKEILGKGTYGTVYEAYDLASGRLEAVKIANQERGEDEIRNEYNILTEVHKHGHIKGIQDPPYCVLDLQHPDAKVGYIIAKYDFSLDHDKFLKKTPTLERLRDGLSLFQGLDALHERNIVHGDIKSANTSAKNGELHLADFGSAKKTNQVTLNYPLSAFTASFTSEADQKENAHLTLTDGLHRIASGKTFDLEKARILIFGLEQDDYMLNREATRLTIASILMKYKEEDLKTIGMSQAQFTHEIEQLKQNRKLLKDKKLDFSPFKLNKAQLDQLQKEAITLAKSHDVYGLGKTMLCILTGKSTISHETEGAELLKLSHDPTFVDVNPKLYRLLGDMLNPDRKKRPTIHEAMIQYNQLIGAVA
jgi:serine/threonine protein kinase